MAGSHYEVILKMIAAIASTDDETKIVCNSPFRSTSRTVLPVCTEKSGYRPSQGSKYRGTGFSHSSAAHHHPRSKSPGRRVPRSLKLHAGNRQRNDTEHEFPYSHVGLPSKDMAPPLIY